MFCINIILFLKYCILLLIMSYILINYDFSLNKYNFFFKILRSFYSRMTAFFPYNIRYDYFFLDILQNFILEIHTPSWFSERYLHFLLHALKLLLICVACPTLCPTATSPVGSAITFLHALLIKAAAFSLGVSTFPMYAVSTATLKAAREAAGVIGILLWGRSRKWMWQNQRDLLFCSELN